MLVNGLSEISEKEIAKQVMQAIEPRRLREMMKDDIVLQGKENFSTRASLFPLVVKHVERVACYEEKMNATSRSNKDGVNRSEWKTGGQLRCFKCRGNHRARDFGESGYKGRYSNYISPVNTRPKNHGEGINNRTPNRNSEANNRGTKSKYGLRENPRPSTRFTESRGDGAPARITGGSSGHFSRPGDKAGGQAKQVKQLTPNGSSGWATLQGQFE